MVDLMLGNMSGLAFGEVSDEVISVLEQQSIELGVSLMIDEFRISDRIAK